MQKYVTIIFFISAVMMITLWSCVYHDFPEYTCDETYSFEADIKPIIETRCALSGCHNGDMGTDLNWTNFDQFHKRAESGEVKFRVTNRIMPPSDSPGGPLTQEQIDALACWTDQGAQNN
jgi:hypothetical protein